MSALPVGAARGPTEVGMELEEVAEELYAVPPEEFTALRKQRQDDARADGDRVLAKEIGGLPRPAAAAWVCNLLVRAHRAEIEALVELGGLLREAQDSLDGDQLRPLNRQRSQLLSALTRQASALARAAGRPVSSSVAGQVEDTLRAAMADPEAGEALLTGRLTSPMSYSGLGTTGSRPALHLVPPSRPARPEEAAPRPRGADAAQRRRQREEDARRAAEERRRRELEEARRAVEEATAAADEARAAAEAQRRRVDDLDAQRADRQARVEELAGQLARAERAAAETAEQLQRAERHRRTAERQATEAATALDSAVAALRALGEE